MKTLALTLAAATLATTAIAGGDINVYDQNGDRFATETEIASVHPGLRRADFDRIDLNNDRRVSANEINTGSAQSILNRYVAGSDSIGLASVDTNGDSFVNFTELAAVYPGVRPADFRQVDVNDDNRLSSVELVAGHNVVAGHRSVDGQVTSLDAIDLDGSNFADFGEVTAAYPGLSSFDFDALDANDDNRISFSELYNGRNILDR